MTKSKTIGLGLLILALNFLNAGDFLLTTKELSSGIAVEGNPIMAWFFEQGLFPTALFKFGMVFSYSAAVWFEREKKYARISLVALTLIFTALLTYHIVGYLFFQ